MKVYKSSKLTIIRPEIFSLTLGFFWAIFVLIVTLVAIASKQSWKITEFFEAVYPWYVTNLRGLILGPIWGFINGFLVGFLIGYIYTLLIKRKSKNVQEFVADFELIDNKCIIQEGKGDSPYTIVFVANPVIYLSHFKITQRTLEIPEEIPRRFYSQKTKADMIFSMLRTIADKNGPEVRGKGEFLKFLESEIGKDDYNDGIALQIANYADRIVDNETFEPDPIMNDNNPELFFKVVIRCIRSFLNNELLSLPEIFPRLRIVAVFKKENHSLTNENALCEDIDPSSDILAPRADVSVITTYLEDFVENPDVIFVISGSPSLNRSSARFSVEKLNKNGKKFRFTFTDNIGDKKNERIHAHFADTPGVVALSAWDNRLKTPVHEFAHAMSSIENGAIVDEYLDQYYPELEERLQGNIINRKTRANSNEPVPDIFARYKPDVNGETITYFSDRYRRDKELNWLSYVPERTTSGHSCIMDISYFGYRFDKLLFDFMYDRLLTKLNR